MSCLFRRPQCRAREIALPLRELLEDLAWRPDAIVNEHVRGYRGQLLDVPP